MMTLLMLTEGVTMAAGQKLPPPSPFLGETLALPDPTYSSLRSPNCCDFPPAEWRLHDAEGTVLLLPEACSRRLSSAGGSGSWPSGWISLSTATEPDVGPPSVVLGARLVAIPVLL